MHGRSDIARVFSLQKKLIEIIKGSNNIATYFDFIKLIWDDIEALDVRFYVHVLTTSVMENQRIKHLS